MKHPNFFIVGAPKCGTTSMYHYLDQHPDIFIPPTKEPRFFIGDIISSVNDQDPIKEYLLRTSVFTKNDYLNLYRHQNEKALGDASTQYLYHHKEVIPQIKSMCKDQEPKILIMLRNPIDRAFSNFSHNSFSYEKRTFNDALFTEHKMIADNFNSFWYYKGLSTYSSGVAAYLEAFDQVKVVIFEEFVKDVQGSMKSIYDFLEVDSNFKVNHFLVNKKNTGKAKSVWLNNFLMKIRKLKFLKKILITLIGQKRLKLVNEIVTRSNLSKEKAQLSSEDRIYLRDFFKDDITKLSKLLPNSNINWQ